jgi:phosphinothricin acetyltransferase
LSSFTIQHSRTEASRYTFNAITVDGEPFDCPEGTSVAIPDPDVPRSAIAVEPATAVLVIGGTPGEALRDLELGREVDERTAAGVTVRPLVSDDWPAVRRIYEEGVATGNATFETEAPDWRTWDVGHTLRLVAEEGGEVLGWAALSPVSERCVYAGVAEDSIYVSTGAQGRGVGRLLLDELVRQADAEGIWTVQTGIFPENEASLGLHERCGFRVVGIRERLGQHNGVWRDVVFMERRSKEVS